MTVDWTTAMTPNLVLDGKVPSSFTTNTRMGVISFNGKLHKMRVNGWRLKPYLTRIEEVFPIGLLEDATTTTTTKEPPDLGEFTSSLLDLFHL